MNVTPKVLHLSLLLAMTAPAMAQTTPGPVAIDLSAPAVEQTATTSGAPHQRLLMLSEDQLQTQDRQQIKDRLQTDDPDMLQTRDRDQLKSQDQDKLQTQDPDMLQTRDRDQLKSGAGDASGSQQKSQQKLQKQEKHEYRNMFQYEERDAGQGLNTGGSMNRRMNSFGGGAAGSAGSGGGGRR